MPRRSTWLASSILVASLTAVTAAAPILPSGSERRSAAGVPVELMAAIRARVATPSTAAPSQQAELTDPDGVAYDNFGLSVAISGSTALVGDPRKDSLTGAAFVFVRTGTTWVEQTELTASDAAASDFFGWSVGLSGSTAVIAAPHKGLDTGAVYVFVRSGTTWSQEAKLTASDAHIGDELGTSVAISGSTVVAGAPHTGSDRGTAYVFVRAGTSWTQQAELHGSDEQQEDQFGFSVAVSVTVSSSAAVVGAWHKNATKGAAYVFARSGQAWSQQAKLVASDGQIGDEFGFSTAVSGSTAIIGAVGLDNSTSPGGAYVFGRSGTTWSQTAKLTASDGVAADAFGWTVTLAGSTALVGAPLRDASAGAAYVFVGSGTSWVQTGELTSSDQGTGDALGTSVALSRRSLLAGAPGKDTGAGAAYVFVLA